MEVSPRTRLLVRAGNLLFVVLLLAAVGLLAWLSTRYHVQLDWTASGRNTLSPASVELLDRMRGDVVVTAFATESTLVRERVRDLVERYRRAHPGLELRFVNPQEAPDRARDLGIGVDGELVVEHGGRSEHVQTLTEQALTSALARLARGGERWLAYLTGHGERDLRGRANHDLGEWGRQLANRGFELQPLTLGEVGTVPDNVRALVLASPRVDLLPGEVELVAGYVDAGGNLLWLLEPGSLAGLEPLAERLGLHLVPGVVVDPAARVLGNRDPRVVLGARYPRHPITERFQVISVFPVATALRAEPHPGWRVSALVESTSRSWSETGDLDGDIRYDAGADAEGPLDLALALTRALAPGAGADGAGSSGKREQRIVVVGDGDFLSNAYLGNQANLDLGVSIANWLSSDDVLVAIPTRTAPDLTLEFTRTTYIAVGVGFLLVVPVVLLAAGIGIWVRRRRR